MPLAVHAPEPNGATRDKKRRDRDDASTTSASQGSSDSEASVPASRLKRTKARSWYAVQKNEKAKLAQEIEKLQIQADFLKQSQAARALSLANQVNKTKVLQDMIEEQRFAFVTAQSALAGSEVVMRSPIEKDIRLGSDWTHRQAVLRALKKPVLRDAERYITERMRFLSPTSPYTSAQQFTTARGDLCSVGLDSTPLGSAVSVKQVYDALRSYFYNMEILWTEASKDLMIREEEDDDTNLSSGDTLDSAVHRFLRSTNNGFLIESSSVMYHRHDEASNSAVIFSDYVDEDTLYPYNPDDRVRQDITTAITVKEYCSNEKDRVVVVARSDARRHDHGIQVLLPEHDGRDHPHHQQHASYVLVTKDNFLQREVSQIAVIAKMAIMMTRLEAGMRNLTRLAEAQAGDSDGHTFAAVLKVYVDCFLSQTDAIPLTSNGTRGVYLLFFDGGSRGNPGPGGTGSTIVRVHKDSHTASLIWAASMAYSRKDTTNNFAEYWGLIHGLREAQHSHFEPLYVIGDSALIISQQRMHRSPRQHRLTRLYQTSRRLADCIDIRGWCHHYRAFNKMADSAANLAMDTRTSTQVHFPTHRAAFNNLTQDLDNDVMHWLMRSSEDPRTCAEFLTTQKTSQVRPTEQSSMARTAYPVGTVAYAGVLMMLPPAAVAPSTEPAPLSELEELLATPRETQQSLLPTNGSLHQENAVKQQRKTQALRRLSPPHSPSGDGESSDPPNTPLPKPKRAYYTLQKEEMQALAKEVERLETVKDFLTGSAAANAQMLAEKVRVNEALRHLVRNQQFAVARAQAALVGFNTAQNSALERYIHLSSDWEQRRETIRALKDDALGDAESYFQERIRFLDPMKKYYSIENFSKANGDTCQVGFDITPLPGITSVKLVLDALRQFLFNMEITWTETSRELMIREGEDGCIDPSIMHQRFLRKTSSGLQIESNTVLFTEFREGDPDAASIDRRMDSGILVVHYVDNDELYPYNPKERLRQDITSAIAVKAYPVKTDKRKKLKTSVHDVQAFDTTTDNEFVVVFMRSFHMTLQQSEILTSLGIENELKVGRLFCYDTMLKSVIDLVHHAQRN
ncbi:hypothetical protein FI667_g7687, partial [Globisporangium splendens]